MTWWTDSTIFSWFESSQWGNNVVIELKMIFLSWKIGQAIRSGNKNCEIEKFWKFEKHSSCSFLLMNSEIAFDPFVKSSL